MKKIYSFCVQSIAFLALVLFSALALCAFFVTARVADVTSIEILLTRDSLLGNVLFLTLFTSFICLLTGVFLRLPGGNEKLLILTCVWVFGFSCCWSYFSKAGPAFDCGSVYEAAKQFARDDFTAIADRDSYFAVYPFQLGLAFFYEKIFRLVRGTNFHILQGINALCLSMIVYAQYRLCGYFFKERKIPLYCLLLNGLCLPLLMYGSYIYGEVPSFAFLLFGTWMLIQFLEGLKFDRETSMRSKKKRKVHFFKQKREKKPDSSENILEFGTPEMVDDAFFGPVFTSPTQKRVMLTVYGILAAVFLVLSVLVRKNTLIFLIALGIILVLYFIRNMKHYSNAWKMLLPVYLICVISFSVQVIPMVQSNYESRSGKQVGEGLPMTTYLAMGLMETEAGPGHYSGYNFETFTVTADYDTQLASEIGLRDYRERLSYFGENPGYAMKFLGVKFLDQWLNVGWAIYDSIYVSFGVRHALIESCFTGPLYAVFCRYMACYQFVLYLFAALGCIPLWNSVRKSMKNVVFFYAPTRSMEHPFSLLFYLTAFGGFLFYMIWEASGRYVLPYGIFIFPNAAMGFAQFLSYLQMAKVAFANRFISRNH